MNLKLQAKMLFLSDHHLELSAIRTSNPEHLFSKDFTDTFLWACYFSTNGHGYMFHLFSSMLGGGLRA